MANFLTFDIFSIVLSLCNCIAVYGAQQPVDISNIYYLFYNDQGVKNYTSNNNTDNIVANTNCKVGARMNFIVPGWKEDCNQGWVVQLIKFLNDPALNPDGGCTCCVDYSYYSKVFNFYTLYSYLEALVVALSNKLKALAAQYLSLELLKIISFSFGSVVSVKASCEVGSNIIGSIDAIDSANPSLQPIGQSRYPTDFKPCAKHVQGIHCSTDFGTSVHNQCHEDWVMGNCGKSQACATSPPQGSHGQCPNIYVYGFIGRFKSVPQPIGGPCTAENAADLNTTQYNVQYMGFKMPSNYGFKTFYADTYACPPFYNPAITNCTSTVPPFA